ncbi:alkylation response protein AidB-like acyl-CoA dehydrogenase [Catenuloplanes nepalensis]|uniref:Alkylation response protein AidB-like acyl-CoA dehydrogenase n=1 Tax=Catenuloplanes nepalensis TaxID=587533 RepID=A0ABT9MN44_9ACTN|nr:acyl-CoA dehydrogenase family protein [Catenuloplanes nepalensis]MDP9792819.1 alkylation response protein AidB-like acyl-CoA dehydrogenase [Catenuloplanes nepalensis]
MITELVSRARALRPELTANGFRADAEGTDVAANMRLLAGAGLNRLSVPVEFGGAWDGAWGGLPETIESIVEVSAADGSTGQCWSANALVARQIFISDVPREVRRQVADELLESGRRLVSSASEAGGKGPVTGRRVPGGIVIDGTKTFNTNSGGGGRDLLHVRFLLEGVPHQALVRLDDPGLTAAHDWDNMGQRGTDSQTITYQNVFVADGWHFPPAAIDPYLLSAVMLTHAALLQGLGEGALEATVGYLRTVKRSSMPKFAGAQEDPLIHRRLGEMSSELAAARALLMSVASEIASGSADPAETGVRGFRAKVASTTAGLRVTAQVHELTGGRGTSNRYRFDRYWRNARAFASHDSLDAKMAFIGAYEVTGALPNLTDYLAV